MAWLFAFLHHAAVFALELTLSTARKLQALEPAKLRAIRRIVHRELAGVVGILLCAALMARGIASTGT